MQIHVPLLPGAFFSVVHVVVNLALVPYIQLLKVFRE